MTFLPNVKMYQKSSKSNKINKIKTHQREKREIKTRSGVNR
jgi:hypothetical protein